jgi:hypothetical protein
MGITEVPCDARTTMTKVQSMLEAREDQNREVASPRPSYPAPFLVAGTGHLVLLFGTNVLTVTKLSTRN